MTDTLFSDLIDRSKHGATWRDGAWTARNWRGWFQSREDGSKIWRFQIIGFRGDHSAMVYQVADTGGLVSVPVPIDAGDRILIEGKRYGRAHWDH
jgi:hypothetical protein